MATPMSPPASTSRDSSDLSTASSGSDFESLVSRIQYSGRHDDIEFQYRHIVLPSELAKQLPQNRIATVEEWRSLGISMSPGWENYDLMPQRMRNKHVMVFRRRLSFGQRYPVRRLASIQGAATPENTRATPSLAAARDGNDSMPGHPDELANPEKTADKQADE